MRLRLFVKGVPFFVLVRALPSFLKDYNEIRLQARRAGMTFPFGRVYPCIEDKRDKSGTASGHYFHQDLLVARKVFMNKPVKHVDIGSRIDGFVAHVASFRDIEVFDIRELAADIQNIHFSRLDITNREFKFIDYCDSVSCLHALEHFGLGRYGDTINYNGHLLGWKNIYSMLKKRGKFYFSVPIGKQRIEFNAHRVFSLEYLINMMKDLYRVDSLSYVDDQGNLIMDAKLSEESVKHNLFCHYGCGIFELTKI